MGVPQPIGGGRNSLPRGMGGMPSPPPGIAVPTQAGSALTEALRTLEREPWNYPSSLLLGEKGRLSNSETGLQYSVSADVRCVRICQRMVGINGPRRGEPLCAVVVCISFRKVENAANTTCALGSESTTGTASSHNALGCVAGVFETGHHFKTTDDHRHPVRLYTSYQPGGKEKEGQGRPPTRAGRRGRRDGEAGGHETQHLV